MGRRGMGWMKGGVGGRRERENWKKRGKETKGRGV